MACELDGPQLLNLVMPEGPVELILVPNLLDQHFPRHQLVPTFTKLANSYPFLTFSHVMPSKLLQKDILMDGKSIAFERGEILINTGFLAERDF